MSGYSIEFFADQSDLIKYFNISDKTGDFVYTARLSKVGERNIQLISALSLMDYLVTYEKPIQANVFLITLPSTVISEREIKMKDGSGIKIAIDQNNNFDANQILLGGEAGPSTVVTTTLRTTGETEAAVDLFKVFKKNVVKNSKKIGANYYVMPGAMEKLKDGWRLTAGITYSKELNLSIAN
jgi:hypothetical protein